MYAFHILTWILIGMFVATLDALLLERHNRLGVLLLTGALAGLVGGGAVAAAGAGAASMFAAAATAFAALMAQESITTFTLRHH